MNITFTPLKELHFPLLLKWLEATHVKAWWDQDVNWTLELVQKKYSDYVKGYKLVNGIAKTITAYIICADEIPVGYIQIYNAYDFPRTKSLNGLPSSLAAIDVLIGEKDYLKRGIGSKAMIALLNQYAQLYDYTFVNPDCSNIAALRSYKKAGFKKIKEHLDIGEIWMLRKNTK